MRNILFVLLAFLTIPFFCACEGDVTYIYESSDEGARVDTLVISRVDTIVAVDTIYSKDTVVLASDTVHSIDTVVLAGDTVHSIDTVYMSHVDTTVVMDTVVESGQYGWIRDSRDDQYYRTVKIGEQVWMADNLNYAYNSKTAELDSTSFCRSSCNDNGRMYIWSAAMDSAGRFSKDGYGCGDGVTCEHKAVVQGVCMRGWHLPSASEWEQLIEFAGGVESAGNRLGVSDVYWCYTSWDSKFYYASDDYGFSANPSDGHGSQTITVRMGVYLSSTESSETEADVAYFIGSTKGVNVSVKNCGKTRCSPYYTGGFVRCVKD